METKHTPGPWGISSENPKIIKAFDALGETNIIIASACGYKESPFFPSDETAATNARLIAAAPELLAALNNLLVGMEASGGWVGDDDLFDAGMRAYRKATGAA